jgi:hypothetical protein
MPSTPVIAPFALVRVPALPYATSASLAPPQTSRAIASSLDARAEMERLRARVEDDLFAVVPAIEDRRLRRRVLSLRRDVHNRRPKSLADDAQSAVLAHLGDAQRSGLQAWLEAAGRVAVTEARAAAALPEEIRDHLRPRLWAAADDPHFARALALASPDLYRSVEREGRRRSRGASSTKVERSLLGYLLRATVKTSPFSTFMHVAAVDTRPDWPRAVPDLGAGVPLTRATLSRGVISRVHAALSQRAIREVRLRRNTTLREVGGRLEALAGREAVLLGRIWREIRCARFRLHRDIRRALVELPDELAYDELIGRLTAVGLEPAQAASLAARLIERDVLWTPPAIDVFDADAERAFERYVDALPGPDARATAPHVTAMVSAARGFEDVAPPERVNRIARIRLAERELGRVLEAEPAEPLANVIVEDSAMVGVGGAVGGAMLDRLAELGRFLGTLVGFNSEYLALRDAFVERYGVGGSCRDPLGFFVSVGELLFKWPEVGAAPRVEPTVRAARGMRMGVTAQLQIAATDAEALGAGRCEIVVNQVLDRVGWLASRHAVGDHPEQAALREHLREWIARCFAPRKPVDLVLNGHVSDLQVHPSLCGHVLAWPGEPLRPDRGGVVRLDELVIQHDRDTDLLDLVDRSGRPLALVYLGSVVPSPTWGVPHALAILSQPFALIRPSSEPLGPRAPDLVFRPRRVEAGIVLTRATWWVRARRLTEVWFANSGVQRLLAVAAGCRGAGIPPMFYARGKQDHRTRFPSLDANAPYSAHKPLWVDVRNPFCLDLLEKMASTSEWIALTEALPGGGDLWASVGGEPRVTELQIEMLIEADPPAEPEG